MRLTSRQVENFWAKVDKADGDGCWEWTASKFRLGYGCFGVSIDGRQRIHGAHRVSWMIANDFADPPSCVLHHCDNRGCVRPSHLYVGTNFDNALDAVERGRLAKNGAKLSREQVREMRLRRRSGEGVRSLSESFGVSMSAVSMVCTGKTYSDYPGPIQPPHSQHSGWRFRSKRV